MRKTINKRKIKKMKTSIMNKSENYIFSEFEDNLEDLNITNLKELYKFGLSEYGKCISKMYIDCEDNKTLHIGYVFEKKMKYDDSDDDYLREVWLSLEIYEETTIKEYEDLK